MAKAWCIVFSLFLVACSTTLENIDWSEEASSASGLMQRGSTYYDLLNLPQPRGQIVAAVYGFRDQTGQYKQAPESNVSTAVPQGTTSMLTQALVDSNWFTIVEREGLQNMLTERKIIRANLQENTNGLPNLSSAQILLEGAVIAYDSNVFTGGIGARYLGFGSNLKYRQDLVTVNLRAIDIRTGRTLSSVTTTKVIWSREIVAGIFKFIDVKDLVEGEAGFTMNEPVSICVMSAIESAVIHLILDGQQQNYWQLSDPVSAENNYVWNKYIEERMLNYGG